MLPHFYHHRYRCRPSEEVIAEAASIQEKALIFWDDNIIGDLDYARDLFRRLIPLRKRWTSQATFNIVDHDDLIQLDANSGILPASPATPWRTLLPTCLPLNL